MQVRRGAFTLAVGDTVDEGWIDRVLGAVRDHVGRGGRTYFRHPLAGFESDTPQDCPGEAFVKVYSRRRAHNLLRRLRRGRAEKEAAGFRAFQSAGVPSVELMAWGEERRRGLWERGLVVTRFINTPNLFSVLMRSRDHGILRDGAIFLANLHRKGLAHGDAGLTNFLPGPSGLLALDLSEWRRESTSGRINDAARMAGSALAAGLPPDSAEEFFEHYLTAAGIPALDAERAQFNRQARRAAAEDFSRLFDAHAIGSLRSHDALKTVLDAAPPGRVLDAPSGHGVLAEFLRVRGWDVHCADIDPALHRLDRVPMTAVDLNRPLPYQSESFDAVVCANALHRLFNPAGAVAEFHRLLRRGGRLYLNINNYASLGRRLRFLLYGSLDNALNSGGCKQTIDNPEANVRVALMLPQLINHLRAAGFAQPVLYPADRSRTQGLSIPLTWLVAGASLLVPAKSRERNCLPFTNSASVLGGGRYVVIVATKA